MTQDQPDDIDSSDDENWDWKEESLPISVAV